MKGKGKGQRGRDKGKDSELRLLNLLADQKLLQAEFLVLIVKKYADRFVGPSILTNIYCQWLWLF